MPDFTAGGSVYDRLTQLIKARDLQSPVGPHLEADQEAGSAMGILLDAQEDDGYDVTAHVAPVKDTTGLVGYIGYFDIYCAEGGPYSVRDLMTPVFPGQCLSGDTPALDLPRLFAERDHTTYLVIEAATASGSLSYCDLFRAPFRLCLLALTLEVETVIDEILHYDAPASWQALPAERKQWARKHMSKQRPAPDPIHTSFTRDLNPDWIDPASGYALTDLLRCLTADDKHKLLIKKQVLRAFPTSELSANLFRLRKVRNACAHVMSIAYLTRILPQSEMDLFVRESTAIRDAVRAARPF